MDSKVKTYFKKKERSWHWTYTTMLCCWFLGFFIIILIGQKTLLSVYELSKYILFFSLICTIIPFKIYNKYLRIKKLEIIFFNLFAIGPSLFSACLILNFTISTKTTYKTYNIRKIEILENNLIRVNLKNNYLKNHKEIRTFEITNQLNISSLKYMSLIIKKGFMGWDVVHEKNISK